jgi:hypothetical protein
MKPKKTTTSSINYFKIFSIIVIYINKVSETVLRLRPKVKSVLSISLTHDAQLCGEVLL